MVAYSVSILQCPEKALKKRLWFRCALFPIGSRVWALALWLVMLFWNAVDPLKGGTLLEEMSHWGGPWGLTAWPHFLLTFCFLSKNAMWAATFPLQPPRPPAAAMYSHCYQVFQLWWLHSSGILSQKKKKTLLLPQVAFVRKFYHIEEIEKAKKGGGDTFKWDFKEYSNNSLEIKKNQKVRKESRWRGKDGKCMIRWSVWALVFGDWYTCKQPQSTNLSTHVGKENYTTWHNYILSKRSQIAGLKTTERKKWYNWKEKDTNH